jgi:hypothetical protein
LQFGDFGTIGWTASAGPGDGTINPIAFLADLRLDTTNNVATAIRGTMTFNTYYYKTNPVGDWESRYKRRFFNVAVHECLHILGLGALWNGPFRIIEVIPIINTPVPLSSVFPYNVVGTGNPTNPMFTAPLGLAAWRETMMGQGAATGAPIENIGMTPLTTMMDAGGTALAHWRGDGGNLMGVYDTNGRDLAYEVITGYSPLPETETWVGKFTLASLRDVGWSIDYLPLTVDLHKYRTVTW